MNNPEVLAPAAERQRVLVSHDVGTMPDSLLRFTKRWKHSAGVFLAPQSLDVGEAIDELLLIWLAAEIRSKEAGFAGRKQIDREFLENHRGDALT